MALKEAFQNLYGKYRHDIHNSLSFVLIKKNLYGIACSKDVSVAVLLELSGGSIQWNVSFAKAAHDWKMDFLALFFKVLYLARVRGDKLWWVSSKRGLFYV
jgi:hypothetical protein